MPVQFLDALPAPISFATRPPCHKIRYILLNALLGPLVLITCVFLRVIATVTNNLPRRWEEIDRTPLRIVKRFAATPDFQWTRCFLPRESESGVAPTPDGYGKRPWDVYKNPQIDDPQFWKVEAADIPQPDATLPEAIRECIPENMTLNPVVALDAKDLSEIPVAPEGPDALLDCLHD